MAGGKPLPRGLTIVQVHKAGKAYIVGSEGGHDQTVEVINMCFGVDVTDNDIGK